MRKLFLFMMVSLDGFFEGPDHDLSWHCVDDAFNRFAGQQMEEMGMLLMGRRTYQLMEDFWPNYTPEDEENRIVRDLMNSIPKMVFSKTLQEVHETADWQQVTLRHDVDVKEITQLKQQKGKPIAVFGSSQLCVRLLELGLLDELRIMVNPVVIGKGTPLFAGIAGKLPLKLLETRTFQNGNVLLSYATV